MTLLKRVIVVEDAAQADAATFFLDKTVQTMTVTVNPALVDDVAREGYRVRGAIQLALNGLGKYNRAITKKYGTYKDEQKLFEQGHDDALFDLEALIAELRGQGPVAAAVATDAIEPVPGADAEAGEPASTGAEAAEPDKAAGRRKR